MDIGFISSGAELCPVRVEDHRNLARLVNPKIGHRRLETRGGGSCKRKFNFLGKRQCSSRLTSEPRRLCAIYVCFTHPTAEPVCLEKFLMSLSSMIGEAGFALRHQLGRVTPKTTNHPLMSQRLERPIAATIRHSFAQQVFMDLQISGRPRAFRVR